MVEESSNAALRLAIAHLLEGLQVIGFDWTYLYVNETAAVHGQRPAKDLVGRTMMSCYPGIEETELFATLQSVMRTRRAKTRRNEFTYPNGDIAWFDLRIEPVPDGICVLSLDVTDKHRMETELHRNEERLRFALQAAQIGVWELRVSSGAMYCAELLEQILGVASDAGPRRWDDFLAYVDSADRSRVAEAFQRVIEAKSDGLSVEFRLLRADGQRRWAECHGRLVEDPKAATSILRGVAFDITDRRTMEQQLQQAQKMEAVGQLAGGVAHDFNNLLTGILGYCDLLLDDLPADDHHRADIEEIKRGGTSAASLTKQLLAFSRKQLIEPQVLVLNEVIADTGRMLQRLVGEDIEMEFHLDPALGSVRADTGQLSQILTNLVVNARDAMPCGGQLTIETRNVDLDEHYSSTHFAVVPGPYVQLTVTDTGTGMSPDVQTRLFEPFFTTKEVGKGTGLGLASVYGIIKQSRGNIWVYSEVGRGTTFKICLPRVDEVRPQPRADVSSGLIANRPATVLVVDDNPGLQALTTRVLRKARFQVLSAESPAAAFQVAQEFKGPIDVLLTDIVMPGQSGPALAVQLAEQRPALRVIHMSGYTEEAIVRHGLVGGSVIFLAKPFTPAELVRKVCETLALPPG